MYQDESIMCWHKLHSKKTFLPRIEVCIIYIELLEVIQMVASNLNEALLGMNIPEARQWISLNCKLKKPKTTPELSVGLL